ncbi:mannose-1-phosphate guanylyltransferase/mannose-6-phosphate isomerase [Aerophototrophica crusticola]|uniref:mannose-1-phosphate guanylyltransferase n=1 Tax=Aerophototrophica crusticola TaxID=1709002 RepID=A0A858R7A1_9PROT|nr:mannose-1-phosphate guanylyltransferase/mannose-6-phosphate isomerase [Rhodospirillaceae bacterium B3]
MARQGARIIPVLMSGGSGSRLWPLSRERYPKQLLPLCGERTMVQETALRVHGPAFADPIVVCNQEHRFAVAEQLRAVGVSPRHLVLEPAGRNTAPALAVAAALAVEADPEALVLALPADHAVLDVPAFHEVVAKAAALAGHGYIVTFGIRPAGPHTGYGYIQVGAAFDGHEGVHVLERFTEKPCRAVAEEYVAGGRHLWNSGILLAPAALLLAELERFEPAVPAATGQALMRAARDLDFLRLDPAAFAAAPSVSIDIAVMERTDRACVIPCDLGWTDVGSWSALWDIASKDADGNVTLGDVMLVDSRDTYVRTTDGKLVAAVGLESAVVVVTEDAVLVAAKDRVEEVKQVVTRLKADDRREHLEHKRVYRPWGYYQSVHDGSGFQVKRITVYPGRSLSLQYHHHRSEHWVVVDGEAIVTVGDEVRTIRANESVYIPREAVHRLENLGPAELHLIEVQTGSYLGEDDIVRLADHYGRS